MGKSRLENVVMKVIKSHYPKLEIIRMHYVPTNRISDSGKWEPYNYCFFIDTKYHADYRLNEIEDFVGAVSGQEIIINVV